MCVYVFVLPFGVQISYVYLWAAVEDMLQPWCMQVMQVPTAQGNAVVCPSYVLHLQAKIPILQMGKLASS